VTIAVRQLHLQCFTDFQILQELEMRIPVTRDDAVADLAGQRTDTQVAGSECESPA
jgi:hypothetical protein